MLTINGGAGFCSNLTNRLKHIISFFNDNHKLPNSINSSNQFVLYKPENDPIDLAQILFDNNNTNIIYDKPISITDTNMEDQFSNYKLLNYNSLLPFIAKYYQPSNIIFKNIAHLKSKYNIDYNNLCVLYYRGLDKKIETNLPHFIDYLNYANQLLTLNPNIVFLLQSDDANFITILQKHLLTIVSKNNIIIFDDIQPVFSTIHHNVHNHLSDNQKILHVINFLSIIIIMSKANHIILNSCNTSMWICLFRGNANNVSQFLSHKKYIYNVENPSYNPSQTHFWI